MAVDTNSWIEWELDERKEGRKRKYRMCIGTDGSGEREKEKLAESDRTFFNDSLRDTRGKKMYWKNRRREEEYRKGGRREYTGIRSESVKEKKRESVQLELTTCFLRHI